MVSECRLGNDSSLVFGTFGGSYRLSVRVGIFGELCVSRDLFLFNFSLASFIIRSARFWSSVSLSSSIIWVDDLLSLGIHLSSISSSSSSSSIETLYLDLEGSAFVDLTVLLSCSHFLGAPLVREGLEAELIVVAAVPSPSGRAGIRVLPRITIS